MRILVVTPTFLPIMGGAETGLYELYKRIGTRHEVHILTPRHRTQVISGQGVKDSYFTEENFKIFRFIDSFNLERLKFPFKEVIPPFSLSYITAVLSHVREFRPHVINFHYAIPGGLALILVRAVTGTPVVLSLIGRTDVLGDETPFLRRTYIWRVVKAASSVVSISQYCLRWPPGTRVGTIIPYGVDTTRFSPYVKGEELKKKLGLNNKTVLFTLQRLTRVKRVDILLESMKYIVKDHKNTVLVIGGKGPEEPELRRLVAEWGVDNHVLFAGYIPECELPSYFAMADIFTFHSTHETFGIVLAQSMASGKPIVSVNTTAIPEVVDNNVNGILVDPLDAEKIARAVLTLINDPSRAETYGMNGRRKAVDKYDWEIVAHQYEEVFKKVVK